MSANNHSQNKWKGLATCKGEHFCAQTYDVCAECDVREELDCRDAVITLEFLPIKNNSGISKFERGISQTNKEMDRASRTAKKLTQEMKRVNKNLRRSKSVK